MIRFRSLFCRMLFSVVCFFCIVLCRSWTARREFQREKKLHSRPLIPSTTHLVTCELPAGSGTRTKRKEFVLNPSGKVPENFRPLVNIYLLGKPLIMVINTIKALNEQLIRTKSGRSPHDSKMVTVGRSNAFAVGAQKRLNS